MPVFVVQAHKARRAGLHYDFRLEMDGVLKSWAFRKQPPEDSGLRRLGILQVDHELSYASFEGEITDGYGAGTVEIWDKGEYELIELKPEKKIEFELNGQRLKGRYIMVSTDRGWLLFKRKVL
jgi:DNA ligase D-like protein (predicted 3'-phosphoesterase)